MHGREADYLRTGDFFASVMPHFFCIMFFFYSFLDPSERSKPESEWCERRGRAVNRTRCNFQPLGLCPRHQNSPPSSGLGGKTKIVCSTALFMAFN